MSAFGKIAMNFWPILAENCQNFRLCLDLGLARIEEIQYVRQISDGTQGTARSKNRVLNGSRAVCLNWKNTDFRSGCSLKSRCPCRSGGHCICFDPLEGCESCCVGCYCIPTLKQAR